MIYVNTPEGVDQPASGGGSRLAVLIRPAQTGQPSPAVREATEACQRWSLPQRH